MFATGFALFRALPSLAQLGMVIALATALMATYAVWRHRIWHAGYDAAIVAIAKQDGKAIAKAKQAIKEVDDCEARGLQYQQSTGRCLK